MMLDTAVRQLRHALAVVFGGRVRVSDVRGFVNDIKLTQAEFGQFDRDAIMEALGRTADPEMRERSDSGRWKQTVRQAYEQTVYYRQLMDQHGLTPERLTLEQAALLPPTPKFAMRALPEAFLNRSATPVLQAFTTGSTGTPTSVWFSQYELELAAAYSAMSIMVNLGIDESDVVQIAVSSRAVLGVQNTMQACRLIGAGVVQTGLVHPAETLARLVAPVHLPGKKPKVSLITTTPSQLSALLAEGTRLGYRTEDFGLSYITCGGEVLSNALRARAEAFFGAQVIDNYAMTESFPLAGLVCRSGHLHFGPEQGLLEVLHPQTYAPVAPGEVGVMVVTPFVPYREATLVLRLDTGDLVRSLTETPTCELAAMPATSPVLGKSALCPGGEDPLYQRDLMELLEAEPAVHLPCHYAIETTDDGFILHVLAADDPGLQSRLEQRANGLPIKKIVLAADPAEMPPPEFRRSMLRETSIIRDEENDSWSLR